jgi:hypothetical protein
MQIHRIAPAAEVQSQVITGKLCNRQICGHNAGRLIADVAWGLDYGSERHREQFRAVAQPIFGPFPVGANCFALSADLKPVNCKLLGASKRSVHWIGNEPVRPDFRTTPA